MFTQRFHKIFGNFVKSSKYFCGPLTWNNTSHRVELSPKLHANTTAFAFLLGFHTLFLLSQAFRFKFSGDFGTFNLIFFAAIANFAIFIYTATTAIQAKDLSQVCNSWMDFCEKFAGIYRI